MPPNKECWSIYVIFLRERCMVSLRHFGSHVRMFWRDSYEITNWVQNIFSDLSICNICSLAAILCIWWLLHSWLSVVTDLEQIDEKKTGPTPTLGWAAPARWHGAGWHLEREIITGPSASQTDYKENLWCWLAWIYDAGSKLLRKERPLVAGTNWGVTNGIPEEMSCYLVLCLPSRTRPTHPGSSVIFIEH